MNPLIEFWLDKQAQDDEARKALKQSLKKGIKRGIYGTALAGTALLGRKVLKSRRAAQEAAERAAKAKKRKMMAGGAALGAAASAGALYANKKRNER